MRRSQALIALLLGAAALWSVAFGFGSTAAAAAGRLQRVPQGFVGMVIDPPTFPAATGVDLAQQLDTMVASGVESVRVEFNWALTQPYQSWKDVPMQERASFTNVDSLPLRLAALDNVVKLAAARGLTVQPDVLDAPSWDALNPDARYVRTPRLYPPYGSFLRALVDRYGVHGSLWRGQRAREPIRSWQLWNEPDLAEWWSIQPYWAPTYLQLLRVGRDAVKRADPGATIVLAGLTNGSWQALSYIYSVPGARRLFDVVGVHPYTRYPQGVPTILGLVRKVMDRAGDRAKPMIADEVGWPASQGLSPENFGFQTNDSGQAKDIAAVMPLLAAARHRLRLLGFDLYNWAGTEDVGGLGFTFAGLLRLQGDQLVPKPALGAFSRGALSLEHCRKKGRTAGSCLRPG